MKNSSRKKILAICGSTRNNSANLQIIKAIEKLSVDKIEFEIYEGLAALPHFNPDIDDENIPFPVAALRNKISLADGVLICTPEYVFSLPGSLKNAIEWMVSTTLFADKPTAIITASGLGEKAHESLQLIMKTVGAKIPPESQMLIQGARSKLNSNGDIMNEKTVLSIKELIASFMNSMNRETDKEP